MGDLDKEIVLYLFRHVFMPFGFYSDGFPLFLESVAGMEKVVVKIPALPGRGFSKQPQLLWPPCPVFVKPYVFLDHFRRHFVPHRPHKVPILPELPSP